MSDSPRLERRYRRLLAFYPATFRREHEQEMLSVLMEGAAEGQQRPRLGDAANLLRHAISTQVQQLFKGGAPLNKGLRGWWLSPPRSGMRRLIPPLEYRHLRVSGFARLTAGSVAATVGVVCLWYDDYGWAAFFLVLGALLLLVGNWYLTIVRSQSSRT